MSLDGQLAFDIDELVREDLRASAPEWQGAPLHFTTDYYAPQELVDAFLHWKFLNGNFGSIPRSHMWHTDYHGIDGRLRFGEHDLVMFSADLRAEHGHEGPGDLMHMAMCEPCEWHQISKSENDTAEGWHDHAIPGWRELPVVPAQIRVRNEKGLTPLAKKWIEANYPPEMQIPGAPIITERAPYGTRHVAGYSPWGGYDLSSTALDTPQPIEEPARSHATSLLSTASGQRSSGQRSPSFIVTR